MEPVLIYQGSNTPIILTLPDDKKVDDISVYLNSGKNILIAKNRLLKSWSMSDVSISGKEISCPITQDESAAFLLVTQILRLRLNLGPLLRSMSLCLPLSLRETIRMLYYEA